MFKTAIRKSPTAMPDKSKNLLHWCTAQEREVLNLIKVRLGMPAIVTYENGVWSVGTDAVEIDRQRDLNGIEYRRKFKEVDGAIIVDDDSWIVADVSLIEEDDKVDNTLRYHEIDAAYEGLGYTKGWTFMGVPDRLLRTASVGVVGLNPGGGGQGDNYKYRGIWDVPTGNGYLDEPWGPGGTLSSVQRQVQAWHEMIGLKPDESFCANFVPFRSDKWSSLEKKDEAVAFAKNLWSWVLEESPATLFVTMGKLPAQYIAEILGAMHCASLPTGWGSQTIDVWDTTDGRRIVGMPHPSRYALFGRAGDASRVAVTSFQAAIAPLKEAV